VIKFPGQILKVALLNAAKLPKRSRERILQKMGLPKPSFERELKLLRSRTKPF
jgi:hypothetical protein